MLRVYFRCNGGDYFSGACCPIDGWSSDASIELSCAVQRLEAEGRPLSIEELRRAGVCAETLQRAIVVDFGDSRSAFDAVSPSGYVVEGTWVKLQDCGASFK